MVRAEYINKDNGSYIVKIKSPDGLRMVQFCAVKAEHNGTVNLQGVWRTKTLAIIV
jgi:hypothetical protein